MPKRLTATETWEKQWFRQLEPRLKCLWRYLCDRCDLAGVWEEDFEQASFMIGEAITEADMKRFGDRVIRLNEARWHLTGFIEHQYRNALKSTVRPQKAVIDRLEKHGLTELYANCIDTVVDKDKDKDKDMDKDKVKEILEALECFSEAFLEAYMNFNDSRKENRHKLLTERAIRMQIKEMQGYKFDEEHMIGCVNRSAANGWQGLFPEKMKGFDPKHKAVKKVPIRP